MSRMTRMLDAERARPAAITGVRMGTVPVSRPRSLSVQRALEWAFGAEHARMDFDLTGAREFDRIGISPEWRIAQAHAIGCRIDGGGQTRAHPDAELIAAAVEALALNPVYGKDMAVLVATCARAGTVPDWRGQPDRRIVPQGWDIGEDGQPMAFEVVVGEWSYVGRQRQRRTGKMWACPISYSGGAQSVGRARRQYLSWYGALLDLAMLLGRPGYLSDVMIVSGMPPLSPWQNTS